MGILAYFFAPRKSAARDPLMTLALDVSLAPTLASGGVCGTIARSLTERRPVSRPHRPGPATARRRAEHKPAPRRVRARARARRRIRVGGSARKAASSSSDGSSDPPAPAPRAAVPRLAHPHDIASAVEAST
jgi:hypothetical protein